MRLLKSQESCSKDGLHRCGLQRSLSLAATGDDLDRDVKRDVSRGMARGTTGRANICWFRRRLSLTLVSVSRILVVRAKGVNSKYTIRIADKYCASHKFSGAPACASCRIPIRCQQARSASFKAKRPRARMRCGKRRLFFIRISPKNSDNFYLPPSPASGTQQPFAQSVGSLHGC